MCSKISGCTYIVTRIVTLKILRKLFTLNIAALLAVADIVTLYF